MRSSESSETDSDEESAESDKDDDEQMPAQGVQTVPLQCTLSHCICSLWQRRNVAPLQVNSKTSEFFTAFHETES